MIIFDLDDTLIDTSGSITPFKLKEALNFLMNQGAKFSDFEPAYQRLLELNAKAPSSSDALKAFLSFYQLPMTYMDRLSVIMKELLPQDFQIDFIPNAKNILTFLKKRYTLALVTGGEEAFQMQKLEKAGIDRGVFSKIAISENFVKKPFYERILQEFSVDAKDAWVCADRIHVDLLPAHELGMKTVHVRWGRGKTVQTQKWIDYTIENLSELKGILKL